MIKIKKKRNKKGYGKIKTTEEWLEKEHKNQWKVNGKRKYRRKFKNIRKEPEKTIKFCFHGYLN